MREVSFFSAFLGVSTLVACGSSSQAQSPNKIDSNTGGTNASSGGMASGATAGKGGGANGGASNGGASNGGASNGGAAMSDTGLMISPKSVVLQPSASQTFQCSAAGTPNVKCTWQVTETDGGTITSAGVYSAPATQGTFHVVATNSADSSQTDTATVVVRLPAAMGCNDLGTAGQWQSVTPPDVPLPGDAPCNYGTLAFVIDPETPSTLYLGTCEHGVWKSANCGSDWTHVNTGTNGNEIDNSRQWTFVIDPINPQVLYTNAGYNELDGNHSGAFRSSDGGVNWTEIWPPSDGSLANVVTNNFVAQINIDPTNHLHLLLGFHQVCAAPYTSICFAETRDGGDSWTIHNADSRWGSSESQTPYLVNDQTWLFANHDTTGGLWVTTNAGMDWTLIAPNSAGHWPGQLYHAASGYYIGSDPGIFRSSDGATWTLVPNSGSLVTGLVGDGTTMWASSFGSYEPWDTNGVDPYDSSLESDGLTWAPVSWTTPAGFKFTQGGTMGYDPVHHAIYSSNGTQGFWRVVVQ